MLLGRNGENSGLAKTGSDASDGQLWPSTLRMAKRGTGTLTSPTLKHTAVAMLVFNRPDKTKRILDAVAKARPPKLLVVADGPRKDRPDDERLCRETRAIFERVVWPCEVLTNYSEVNLGCKERILTGLDWVFSKVPEAIILEDDCLPDPSFFPYCEEMLARYRTDERVHMVRGGNFFGDRRVGSSSYHFSRWYHIWGWATWARAWRCTDQAMIRWPELRDSGWLEQRLPLKTMVDKARQIFDNAYANRVTTWEYHFTFGGWTRDAMAICPAPNMVTNIGFGADAAHYTVENHPHSMLQTAPMQFPLRHPQTVTVFEKADRIEWELLHPRLVRRSLWRRAFERLRRDLASSMRVN